jgi:hypothetical protein
MSPSDNIIQQFFDSYLTILVTVAIVNIVIQLVIGHLVAKAARMKNRSYASFYWLTLILGWQSTALIVAILPFNLDDPRHPINKSRATFIQQSPVIDILAQKASSEA